MRIDGSSNPATDKQVDGKARAPESADAARAKTAQPTAESSAAAVVVVSSDATRATQRAEETDRAFADKVKSLKAAIESGTYKVDKDQLAKRLVEHEILPGSGK